VKAKSLAEEATMLDKLKVVLCDVKNQKNANRNLEKTITDMQIEREAVGKAHDELARRSQSLENDLQRAEQACKELVAHKERLEGENYAMLQQLEESNKREKRNLQLIQDLEQEIRHTVKNHSEMNLASMRSSGTPTPAH
jgi:septal ring factor EnvC (AmiA/AmiB activator)